MNPTVKALVWKEWREQRPILLVGLGLSVVVPTFLRSVATASSGIAADIETMEMIPLLLTVLLWPLFAAAIGATAGGEGRERGSLPFLLSRPSSRRLVWTVKLVVGAGCLALVIVVSSVAAQIHHLLIMDRFFTFPFPANLGTAMSLESAWILALGGVALCLALAMFLGLFIRQQLTVAVAAMTTTVLVCAAGVGLARLFSASTSLQRSGAEPFLTGYVVFSTVAVLAGSYRVFRVGGLMQGADLWRAARGAVPMMVIISALGLAASVSVATRPRLERAILSDATAVPGRQAVLIEAGHNDFVGKTFFLAEPGNEPTRLTRRGVLDGLPSPDGQWLVYTLAKGFIATRPRSCELRRVRLDGTGDISMTDNAPCYLRPASFSPDGARIAFDAGYRSNSIVVADMRGGSPIIVSLSTPGADADSLSWLDENRILVGAGGDLWVARPDSGQVHQWTVAQDNVSRFVRAATLTPTHVVVLFRPDDDGAGEARSDYRQALVDIETGEEEEFLATCERRVGKRTGFVFGQVAASPDGRLLWYAPCTESEGSATQLWVRDLGAGTDRLLADVDGELASITPSPGSSRALVMFRAQGSDVRAWWRYLVVGADGTVTGINVEDRRHNPDTVDPAMAGQWFVRGWVDDQTLLMWTGSQRRQATSEALATMNLVTGEKRILVESECSRC